jgi:hypothetical protein
LVNSDVSRMGENKNSQIARGYGRRSVPITGALTAVSRSFLSLAIPIPVGCGGHDVWFTYIVRHFSSRWSLISETLQFIRRHDQNTSEWIVNSLDRVSPYDVLMTEIKTAPAAGYFDRSIANVTLRRRLSCEQSTLLLGIQRADMSMIMATLRKERRAIARRQKLVRSRRRLYRLSTAIIMFFLGDYKYFNGLRSLARDLLR